MIIYDNAYYYLPDGNGMTIQMYITNFEGTVSHELTHVATDENPLLVYWYKWEASRRWLNKVGFKYYSPSCTGDCVYEEQLAMVVSAYLLQRETLEAGYLDSWQQNWLERRMTTVALPPNTCTSAINGGPPCPR